MGEPRTFSTLLLPLGRFIRTQASGGLLLLACTAVAMAWANSPWAGSYHALWHLPCGIGFGDTVLSKSLHHWINDGLMAIFFFLVGLEIKRELLTGELASWRQASLPVAAAIGGMAVPALLYAAFNASGPGSAGWGIPMATDIAFALGVLALLGPRVPVGVKVLLTALAIVDDLGAVLVIAVFYTSDLAWSALALGAVFLALSMLANRLGVHRPVVYALLGVCLWVTFLASGIHATIAGVLLALTIPARRAIHTLDFIREARSLIDEFEREDDPTPQTNERQRALVRALETRCEEVQAPLNRIEHALHPWVAWLIMPLFALANAGIGVDEGFVGHLGDPITMGVIAGLFLGKPLGVVGAVWLAVRLRLSTLPPGVGWPAVIALGFLAGIGFTMSLFVTGLAFPGDAQQAAAKVGILLASLASGVIGWWLMRRTVRQAG